MKSRLCKVSKKMREVCAGMERDRIGATELQVTDRYSGKSADDKVHVTIHCLFVKEFTHPQTTQTETHTMRHYWGENKKEQAWMAGHRLCTQSAYTAFQLASEQSDILQLIPKAREEQHKPLALPTTTPRARLEETLSRSTSFRHKAAKTLR